MLDTSPSTQHSIYVSGNFEIENRVSPITIAGSGPEYITYAVSIGCRGADRDARLLYEIRATGLAADEHKLYKDHTYFLRGPFFPTNLPQTESDQFIFKGADATLIASLDNYEGESVDSVGISGLGIVINIEHITEKCCQYLKKTGQEDDLQTTVVTMQHSEFNPISQKTHMSKVEYLIRPTPNLACIATYLKTGRECAIHGYIKDFNVETSSYVVVFWVVLSFIVYGIHHAGKQIIHDKWLSRFNSTHQSKNRGKWYTIKEASQVSQHLFICFSLSFWTLLTYSSRFVSRAVSSPFVSPIPTSGFSRAVVSGSGEGSELQVESGSGSSPALSLPSTSSSVPKGPKTTGQPPKKRARAPPKAKAKKSVTIAKSR
ncbi:uncharacterized protein MELLADRAFT_62750 [Melampsora larici-populina 98AG31]|uniref:Uncharacterized protein n=1 Tax=Melampsora larici-populina (strain 98AG31 / pathotype 3-4-7) TaxID=747676 RepID=F4RK35_MELLP|nr:uncharacterized protein MELLADRAFT_62750 [Melampsora larici-populina 98AG31]EGG07254.1 hypothetical protein MELLADRAFT_62750 [Melampsora larici-populina 98AG31]